MVLQPATMQNQFCSRTATPPSLLPPPPPGSTSHQQQHQQQQHQQKTTGGFSQPLLQTGYISVPRGDETTSIFHTPNGQFTTNDEPIGNTTTATTSGSGFIEVVAANSVDGSRSIVSTGKFHLSYY